jgi:hypothetical protein
LNLDSLSVHQGIGHPLAGLSHNPSESGPGDLHSPGGFILIHPFQISQPQSL